MDTLPNLAGAAVDQVAFIGIDNQKMKQQTMPAASKMISRRVFKLLKNFFIPVEIPYSPLRLHILRHARIIFNLLT